MSSKLSNPRIASPEYGRRLFDTLPAEYLESAIVLTQPEPWDLVVERFPLHTTQMHLVTTMEHSDILHATQRFGPARAVFGIGGGSALDHAKFTAWHLNLPLVLVPTILSVDAAYTKAVGIREDKRVRYIGEVYPERLLLDFSLLGRAPRLLNLSGVGDILSIFTALWDWQQAGQRIGEPWDANVATESATLLEKLFAGSDDLRHLNDDGLTLLSELYVGEVHLCEQVGSSRPEEGSEHYLAYALEAQTRRSFLHGQLVALCVLVVGQLQGQDIGPVARFLSDIGLGCTLEETGLSRHELLTALTSMHDYVRAETQLLPGLFHFRKPMGTAEAETLLNELQPWIGGN